MRGWDIFPEYSLGPGYQKTKLIECTGNDNELSVVGIPYLQSKWIKLLKLWRDRKKVKYLDSALYFFGSLSGLQNVDQHSLNQLIAGYIGVPHLYAFHLGNV